jgi:signal peptidase II
MSQEFAVRVRKSSKALYGSLALAILAGDQATKALVERSVPSHTVIPVIPHFLNLVYNRNPGAAFGLFSDSPARWKTALLVVASIALLVLVVSLVWKSKPLAWQSGVGLALILGGAVSNLIDRIRFGQVLDFIDAYVGSYHWPSFNLADSAIVAGAGFLIFHLISSE